MELLILLGICVLNFAISWWNAYVCGRAWVESRALGGFIRLVVWCAAMQSAIGFSMVLVVILGFAAGALGYLDAAAMKALFSLWYLGIIVPALGSGLIITIHSWIVAFRERSLLNMGTAAYNTFAQAYNTYQAVSGIGEALGSVTDFFSDALESDNDAKTKMAIGVILLVLIAVLGGILITATLIQRYAATDPLPARADYQPRRRRAYQ
jgi:hypothetical protein